MLFRSPLLCFSLFVCSATAADETLKVDARELPRFAPNEPTAALWTFQVKRGFHLELVAAEPLVASPVAISFDENGRMFVAEMRDYSEQRDERPHLGRIRMLTASAGDGGYDRATIFADDLPWPTAVFWANGGVFVCATPDIWFLKDTDGDGRADVREIVFTGFNTGNPKLNVQALPNCFAWGPDNRVHLQTGSGNRGMISSPKRPDLVPQELSARDFWFDPRTLAFGFEAGGGQYGMSYDDRGRRFVCNNSDHLRTYLFDARYAARNSFIPLPWPLASVAADGPAAEVFRISPDEPWRVIRTRWRVSGRVPGAVEGGGRVSGYFTGATGTTVYRGDAFGPEFVGNTFTGDAGGNLVHRKQIRADGVSVVGERPADERKAEFVASRDTWFRPVNFANTPDGTLYIIDMYREVIEHPWSIPEPIKQHLDLTSGRDRGRIWRIAPEGFKPRPVPKLGAATTEQLVATLANANGWHRDAATRLLWERRDPAANALLDRALTEEKFAPGRLHALRALDGLDAITERILIRALADADDAVRELAVKLCEKVQTDRRVPDALWKKLEALADDAAPRVRLQLAFTLGDLGNDGVTRTLARLAKRDADDRWISAAIRSLPPDSMSRLFSALMHDDAFLARPSGADFLAQLAVGIGARHEPQEVEVVLAAALGEHPQPALIAALGEGLSRTRLSLAEADRTGRLPALFAAARKTLGESDSSDSQRIAAARLLGFDHSAEARAALLEALTPRGSDAMIRGVFDALNHLPPAESANAVIERWRSFDVRLQNEAARFLAANATRARALIDALEKGRITAAEIPAAQAVQLRKLSDPQLANAAARLLPAPVVESRDAVIQRLSAALQLAGDTTKGHAIFTQRCATCHRLRGEGTAFGPDLESVVTGGKEKLLTHIIDPNREVAPQFAAYTAELTDGSTLAGVLASESPEAVVLREPLGRETPIPRSRLTRLQTTGSSPMPEGLEAGLQAQDFADLLAFLTGEKPR